MTGKPPISGAIHDLQARLGSIRIAVTAVVGLDLDAETRNEMLTTAAEESVRASSELAGIGVLCACALESASPAPVDVAAAVREAVELARLTGLDVDAPTVAEAVAMVATERLVQALSALIRITSGAAKQIGVVITTDNGRIGVRIDRTSAAADTEALPPLVGYLADAIGATREPSDNGVHLSFVAAP